MRHRNDAIWALFSELLEHVELNQDRHAVAIPSRTRRECDRIAELS